MNVTDNCKMMKSKKYVAKPIRTFFEKLEPEDNEMPPAANYSHGGGEATFFEDDDDESDDSFSSSRQSDPVPIRNAQVQELYNINDHIQNQIVNLTNVLQNNWNENQRKFAMIKVSISSLENNVRNNAVQSSLELTKLKNFVAELDQNVSINLAKCKSYTDKRLKSDLQGVEETVQQHGVSLNRQNLATNIVGTVFSLMILLPIFYMFLSNPLSNPLSTAEAYSKINAYY